ncbi:MAG: hypothetical protein A2176_04895 [Spirochaetes bacterium RBG_13_51_14]|nr:MAG: hypothetical protein A2176_04895 [Spirochaetes bacterium RBG_13_51_14]
MNIVYYTGGILGSGRLVFGMSIGNALERRGVSCTYTMVHHSSVSHIADDFKHIKIPFENEHELSPERCRRSVLYKTIRTLKPELLIVNHNWFSPYHFIDELSCKKIYLADYTYDSHFTVPLPEKPLVFRREQYHRVIAIEPFESSIPMERINPLVIRNRDEILSREKALTRLGLDASKPLAFYGFGYQPEHIDRLLKKYSYLEKEYEIVRLPYDVFPAVDYYNAFDLIVCAGGYNNVWEVNYFNKNAIFEPIPMAFSDQSARIEANKTFRFDVNGADQLVDIIMNL